MNLTRVYRSLQSGSVPGDTAAHPSKRFLDMRCGPVTDPQKKAAMALLHTALSDTAFEKTTSIIKLEAILREVEGRPADDDYRDHGKYYFSMFGNPATDSIWGWRLEGHHISFNFSAKNNSLISGTPGFL